MLRDDADWERRSARQVEFARARFSPEVMSASLLTARPGGSGISQRIARSDRPWLDDGLIERGERDMPSRQQERLPFHHPRVRPEWLANLTEAILDPGQPIIDPHHHLWKARPDPYLLADLVADLRTGHDVRATVFIQCRSAYRKDGPEEMQPVGETEFVAAAARECEGPEYGGLRACAGIIGQADCLLGERIDAVLEAHIEAGGGRFKGIRHSGTYDAGIAPTAPPGAPPGLYRELAFRAGVRASAPPGDDVRGLAISSATRRPGRPAACFPGA